MHTVVLLQGKCKSINVYRRAIYRRARRGGKLIKKNGSLSLATSPLRYTHTMFVFPSFLFPGDLHDSLDILWQPLATCHQGEAMYIGGLWRGDKPDCFFPFFPWPPLPLREAIYIYIHTHYVCFSSFLFPGNLHDSLDILWQPLRKSDNLCGSLAIPSQVYEHKGLNMM